MNLPSALLVTVRFSTQQRPMCSHHLGIHTFDSQVIEVYPLWGISFLSPLAQFNFRGCALQALKIRMSHCQTLELLTTLRLLCALT
jgi:hypothetical protein